jgi:cell division protein FtsB
MDIVKRLRDEASMYDADDVDLHLDAVEEIERLRQQNAKLMEEINKLKQAKEINKYDTHYPDDGFGGYPSVYNRR